MPGGVAIMPPWPEILSKYNILLSQSHSLSMTLAAAHQASTAAQGNPYERIALAPHGPLSDAQVDGDFIHHLRMQPTVDVLRAENNAVRHLAGNMDTKGSLGAGRSTRTCEEMRVERGTRVVELMRERYDWKSRVEMDQEEPEDWEPGFGGGGGEVGGHTPSGGQSNDGEEEEGLEEVLAPWSSYLPLKESHTGVDCCIHKLFTDLLGVHELLKLVLDSNTAIPASGILDFDACRLSSPVPPASSPRQLVILDLRLGGYLKGMHDTSKIDCWREAFTSFVESTFDHAEAAGTHADSLRAIGFFLVDDCEVPMFVTFTGDDAPTLADFDPHADTDAYGGPLVLFVRQKPI
ncbi:uncharacterized protein BXZ73DRAFT_77202 [Epithele typhae]|uniref:uncharacterized protein n=1 Tax=Epithele typhae TaxID=378194 RepID=UPI002008B054|nr:uncharacterized protein BXZ73DRAFT_77202 [Epithele typhae]KAH9933576.1 hypothetical protein BXZ73DRAFT_77202 [Epithele typhae]